MDAAPFEAYAEGAAVEDAFRTARRRHPEIRGTDDTNITGSGITGPNDYIVVSAQPIPLGDAQVLAELLRAGNDSRVRDPGAAAAIAVHTQTAGILPRPAAGQPSGWLFVGWTKD